MQRALPHHQPSPRVLRPLDPESFGFILLIGFATAIQALCTTLMLPALPQMAQDLRSTPDIVQLTISGFMIGLASGQLISGALSDRFGRRPVLLFGMGLTLVASIGCTFAPTIGVLIGFRVLQGLGGAAGMVVGRAIIRDRFEGQRMLRAMSTLSAIVSIMPMTGPPLTGVLLHWMPWRGVFALITLFALVVGVLIWLRIAESLAKPDARAANPRRLLENCWSMLRRADCMSFAIIGALMYGGLISVISILGFVARDSFALDTGISGLLQGSMALTYSAGAMINSRLSGRWPVRRILRSTTTLGLACGIATLVAAFAIAHGAIAGMGGLAALMVPAVIFNFAFGATFPTVMVMVLQPLPHMAGTASALAATAQTLTGALMAWLAGYLYDGTPSAMGYCVALVGLVAFLMFRLVAVRYTPG